MTKSFTGLFCDDTILAKEISTHNDAIELQNDLDNVLQWTKLWGMQFNTVTCVQMTVTNKKKILNTQYYLGKEKLKPNNYVKYLGVTLTKN